MACGDVGSQRESGIDRALLEVGRVVGRGLLGRLGMEVAGGLHYLRHPRELVRFRRRLSDGLDVDKGMGASIRLLRTAGLVVQPRDS